MIIEVAELKNIVDTSEKDEVIEFKLKGIESLIMAVTNNKFYKYRDNHGIIIWPDDIKLGVINLYQWDIENRDKLGIASESLSRHSVSYTGLSGDSEGGYPKALMGFLTPYMKARF